MLPSQKGPIDPSPYYAQKIAYGVHRWNQKFIKIIGILSLRGDSLDIKNGYVTDRHTHSRLYFWYFSDSNHTPKASYIFFIIWSGPMGPILGS